MTCVKIVVVSKVAAPDHIARIYIPVVSGKIKGGNSNDETYRKSRKY